MSERGWTEAELAAMTPDERERKFATGFIDLTTVAGQDPELIRHAHSILKEALGKA